MVGNFQLVMLVDSGVVVVPPREVGVFKGAGRAPLGTLVTDSLWEIIY